MVFNTFSFEVQKREKIRNYRTGFWNFGLITKLPLAGSSTSVSLHLAYDGAVRRRSHLAAPRVAPPPKTAPAPLVCVAPLPAGDPPSSTRACASPSRQAAGHLWPPLPGQLAPSSPSPDSPSPSPWAYKRQNSSSFCAPEPCPPSTAPPWPASAGAPWTTPIHPSSAPTEPLNGFLSEIRCSQAQ